MNATMPRFQTFRNPVPRRAFFLPILVPALLAAVVATGCSDEPPAPEAYRDTIQIVPAKASAGMSERVSFKPKRMKKKGNRHERFTFADDETAKDVTYDFDRLVYGHTAQNVVRTSKDGVEEHLEVREGELPDDFPADIPVYRNARIINSGRSAKGDSVAYMLNLKVQDDFFTVSRYYNDALSQKGFTVGKDLSPCNEKIMRIMADKGEDTSLSIAIYEDGTGTYILINMMMKKPASPAPAASPAADPGEEPSQQNPQKPSGSSPGS